MRFALEQARLALEAGEVPVGCVIVKDGTVIGAGYNRRETDKSVLGHAELMAIRQAEQALGDWRLTGCALYVTLEPCPMCAGAILNARIDTVVCGASDHTFGACGGVMNLFEEAFGFHPKLYKGVLKEECGALMTSFFSALRD
ncbi:MAG: nucleoside deaminase, partial [Clostridia bacterium]|nr:nucleoside deaminase [Clostridia bacterium]